jgi:hypothetical protein
MSSTTCSTSTSSTSKPRKKDDHGSKEVPLKTAASAGLDLETLTKSSQFTLKTTTSRTTE